MPRPKGSTNKKKETEEIKEEIVSQEIVEEITEEEVVETPKKTTRKPRAKKVEPVVEEEEEIDEESLSMADRFKLSVSNGKERGIKKASRKQFHEDDMVPVASFASGTTKLTNKQKPYDETIWDGFGVVEDVRYGTLEYIKNRNKDAFSKMLYILDEDVIKSLGLTKVYDKLGRLEEIIDIFNQSTDVVLNFIDKSNKEVKNVLREILTNKIERKESIDLFKFKAVAEKLDMELNLDI